MLLFKFSFIVLFSFYSCFALASFDQFTCLNSSFTATVSHKGNPFGFADNILTLEKNGCVITIGHKKMKFVNNKWLIDVCRGPVHIKFGAGAIEVFKRGLGCGGDSDGDYCNSLSELKQIIQDDGLIFADGEKEDLNSDHGRVYCSYMLIKAYLDDGTVFSRHEKRQKIISKPKIQLKIKRKKKQKPIPLPVLKEEKSKSKETVVEKQTEEVKAELELESGSGSGKF